MKINKKNNLQIRKIIQNFKYYRNKGFPTVLSNYSTTNYLKKAISYEEKLENKNLTKNNHIFPVRFFANWENEIKNKKHKIHNLRDYNIKYEKNNIIESSELKDFMSIEYFFIQVLEDLFNNYKINNFSYKTEYINIFEKIQKLIKSNIINSFICYFKKLIENDEIYVSFNKILEFKDPLPEDYSVQRSEAIKNELERLTTTEVELFINFFKCRQFIWKFKKKTNNLTVEKILEVMLLDNNIFQNYKNVINNLSNFLVHFSIINNNSEVNFNELKNKLEFEEIKDQFDSNIVWDEPNKKYIKIYLENIRSTIKDFNYENSYFYKLIISSFFMDKLEMIIEDSKNYSTICLFLQEPLDVKENPILKDTITLDNSVKFIKKGLENFQKNKSIEEDYIKLPYIEEEVEDEYKDFNRESKVYMLPITPNILLINSETWFCEIILSYYINEREEIINTIYKGIFNNEIAQNNEIKIIQVSGVKKKKFQEKS